MCGGGGGRGAGIFTLKVALTNRGGVKELADGYNDDDPYFTSINPWFLVKLIFEVGAFPGTNGGKSLSLALSASASCSTRSTKSREWECKSYCTMSKMD